MDSKYIDLARINEKFKNFDYFSSDIVDTLNLEDMQGRDETLMKENQRLKENLGVLEEERVRFEGELDRVREKCERVREEVEDELGQESVNCEKSLEILDKELEIMGKRFVEISGKNDDLDIRLYRVRDEHDKCERELKIVESKAKKLHEWDEKNETKKRDEERQATDGLKSQQNKAKLLEQVLTIKSKFLLGIYQLGTWTNQSGAREKFFTEEVIGKKRREGRMGQSLAPNRRKFRRTKPETRSVPVRDRALPKQAQRGRRKENPCDP